jgi:hypothetical protein
MKKNKNMKDEFEDFFDETDIDWRQIQMLCINPILEYKVGDIISKCDLENRLESISDNILYDEMYLEQEFIFNLKKEGFDLINDFVGLDRWPEETTTWQNYIDLESAFITLAEHRQNQINSILDDEK